MKKRFISLIISMLLILGSFSGTAQANLFGDFFGGLLTIIIAPVMEVVAPNNPTYRKNNPFRKKQWEEQVEEEQKEKEREETRKIEREKSS